MLAMTCVFCDFETSDPVRWVSREADAMAFLPLVEITPGHCLVAPTKHAENLFDVDPESLAATTRLLQRVAKAMRTSLGATAVNVLHSTGKDAEQSVFHLHFHVVPRWPNDGYPSWATDGSLHHLDGDPDRLLAAALTAS